MARDWEQVTGQAAPGGRERPPRVRRVLCQGPRVRADRHRSPRPAATPAQAQEQAAEPAASTLTEWHEMTPGEQAARWAQLRAWVTWLHDRYELSAEDRLPACWPAHPGLVEELNALMTWRQEIYSSGTQPAGQAARYWHAELRQVLHAAANQYALGCRTGHRAAPRLAAGDAALQDQWAAASPLARIPGTDLAAGTARRAGQLAATASIAAALDDGGAIPVPGPRDTVFLAGTWLAPASAGWTPVPGPTTPSARHYPILPGTTEEEGNPDPWQP